MRSVQKVKRLLQLHDSLLRMREWEQKLSAEALSEAETELQAISATIFDAENSSMLNPLTGHEALMWRLYLDHLGDKMQSQANLVEEKKLNYEAQREKTILAYQEKEKWSLQKSRMENELLIEQVSKEIKTADDLAIQRYVENNRSLFEEVDTTGEIQR